MLTGNEYEAKDIQTSDSPFVRNCSVLLLLRVGLLPGVSPRLDVAQPRLQHLNRDDDAIS